MKLTLATWQEVETHLQSHRGVVLPLGSTEQHGPVGLLGTDALCPEAIASGMAEQPDVLVAPVIPVGNAQHHLAFAGTLSLRPSTLVAVLRDLVESLARHGVQRIWVLNGHGGNIGPVQTAFSEIHGAISLRGARTVRCELHNWWEGPRVSALVQELFGDAEGQHGTCSEISLTWHLHPDRVRSFDGGPGPRENGIFDADDFRRRYPDGRIGSDPSLCTPECGERVLRAAIEDALELYRRFVEG